MYLVSLLMILSYGAAKSIRVDITPTKNLFKMASGHPVVGAHTGVAPVI